MITLMIQPWCDGALTPCCRQRLGILLDPAHNYSGPPGSTLKCPACGTGWIGSDAETEQALVAEAWWDALRSGAVDEADFRAVPRA